jgi:nucleoid-associated protein YgaU
VKKILMLMAALVAAASIGAQSLKDNSNYQKSLELMALAEQAFADGDYDAASDYAAQAKEYALLSDQYVEKMLAMTRADKAMETAKAKMAWAEARGVEAAYPGQMTLARGEIAAASAAYGAEDYQGAEVRADSASESVDAIAKAEAEAAIAKAQGGMGEADKANYKQGFPSEYASASVALADATAAYGSGDYGTSIERAEACLATLASIRGKDGVLPAIYVVRLIPERRDCLWRIAEYPFIYNNARKWPVIYDYNKKTFRDPGNPNLIYPGQELTIPSIAGEPRAGTYDPAKKYKSFVAPKK